MTTARYSLEYVPRAWQVEAHKDKARFRVLALHRRAGKTFLAVMELIDRALRFDKELGLFIYCAPFLKQAKQIAWNMLKYKLKNLLIAGIVEINEADLSVHFRNNGAQIKLLGGDNPDAMRGVRLDGCVIDEVAQIKPEVWLDILQPALSDRKGWALFIGTPSGINLFSEIFFKAKSLSDWSSRLYTVYDTEAIDKDEVERLRRDMAEASFSREYLCDFSAAGDDQLISMTDIECAVTKRYTAHDVSYSPRIIGVDPARFGDDSSVIVKRQGLLCFDPLEYHGIDNMALATRVAQQIEEWEPDAVFIDAGNGAGIIDRLRQLGHEVFEVNFGGASGQPQYANKRAEMWFEIKKWLQQGAEIPNHQRLKQDLGTPVYRYDRLGKMLIEPKEDIKKRGLPSPDFGDALACTFASPVAKKALFSGSYKNKHQIDYEPLDSRYINPVHQTNYEPDWRN